MNRLTPESCDSDQPRPLATTRHRCQHRMHAICLGHSWLNFLFVFGILVRCFFQQVLFKMFVEVFARISLAACSSAGGVRHCKPLSATVLLLHDLDWSPKFSERPTFPKVFTKTSPLPPGIRTDDKLKVASKVLEMEGSAGTRGRGHAHNVDFSADHVAPALPEVRTHARYNTTCTSCVQVTH